ncbi:MAG: dihydrolipoyl dehydrogenase [Candidatus Thorarchaeota archaeon]
MVSIIKTDIAIIGGGPAGYVAAIRAAQLQAKVVLIEKGELGGTCLNKGCIPTKVLVESAGRYRAFKEASRFGLQAENVSFNYSRINKRKSQIIKRLIKGVEFLLRKNQIQVLKGQGSFIDQNKILVKGNNESYEVHAINVIIATGSKPMLLPIPGIDGSKVLTSDDILELSIIPKSMIVIGGGVIGAEFSHIFSTFGCKITILEMLPELIPMEDPDLGKELEASFIISGVKVYTNSRVIRISDTPDENKMVTFIDSSGNEQDIEAEYVLIAIGRTSVINGLNLDSIGIKYDQGIFVNTKMQTNVPNVFAAGDVIQGQPSPMLAYTASHEGEIAVENALGYEVEMNYNAIPSTIFTNPEVASVGLSEDRAKEKVDILVGTFPFQVNGRAIISGQNRGLVKVILDAKTTEIIGVHIIGPNATDLIAEGALAVANRMKAEDLIKVEHAHPVFYETIKEATLDALGCAIHK